MDVCIDCVADELSLNSSCSEILRMRSVAQQNARRTPAFKSKAAEDAYYYEKARQESGTIKKNGKKPHNGPWVYFCAWADRPNAIKIGYTVNVLERMKSFLTGSPSDLWLIAVQPVKNVKQERLLHAKFDKHKIRGEWFHVRGSLFSYVASLDQALAVEQFLYFPAHYQSSIYVPSLSSFIEINL